MLRIGGLCFALGLVVLLASAQDQSGRPQVFWAEINSTINPGAAEYLKYAISKAEQSGASALVVQINTPGGLLSTTRDMVAAISESQVPIIGFVGPAGASATSAGAFILLSTHLAVMNAGTNVGAASPVSGQGGEIQGTMAKKVMNDTVAFMKSVAAERGRNVEHAQFMVIDASSYTYNEAKELDLVDAVVDDRVELFSAIQNLPFQFHGETRSLEFTDPEVVSVDPRFIDKILIHLAHPQLAYLLFSLGSFAIYMEILSGASLIFPGVFGAISVILGLICLQSLPVQFGFLLLLCLGLLLMFSEYFVAGFGALGIGGAIAFVLGSLHLFEGPAEVEFQESVRLISFGVATAFILSTLLITRWGFKGARQKLMTNQDGEAMVSFTGHGPVLMGQVRVDAFTREPLRRGDRVRIVGQLDGDRVEVQKA